MNVKKSECKLYIQYDINYTPRGKKLKKKHAKMSTVVISQWQNYCYLIT